MPHLLVKIQTALLLLLLLASLWAASFRRLKLPFSVGLVLIGFALGFLEPWMLPIQHLVISPDLILFTFVPPLIFASASNLNNRLFFRNLVSMLILAGPGLVLSAGIVGALLAWLTPLSLSHALLFGALISATDPVAVVALFEDLGVPARLKILVDGESMLNDATAIVAFSVVMGIVTSGGWHAGVMGNALLKVIVVLLGGALVGGLLGSLMKYAIAVARGNPLIQFTVSVIIAYFSFIIGDLLKVSGVVAVMTAGLLVGRYKADLLKSEVRIRVDDLWEYAAFLANGLIFLLVGLTATRFFTQPQAGHSGFPWGPVMWAIGTAIVARGVMIFTLTPSINPFLKEGHISWRYQVISFWGGLRGAVALALALSLATDFPERDLLVAMTLGVAAFTIVVGGLTAGPLIHRLKLDRPEPVARLEEAQALLLARQEALRRLAELKTGPLVTPGTLDGQERLSAAQLDQASRDLARVWTELSRHQNLCRRAVWLQALHVEKWEYQGVYDQGILSERNFDKLKLMMSLKGDAILANRIPPPIPGSEAVEGRLEKRLTEMVTRLFPGSKRVQRQRDRSIQERYEFDLAVAFIGEHVGDQIRDFGRQVAAETGHALFDECSAWYAAASQKNFQRLKVQGEQHPDLVLALQRQVVAKVALASARNRLDKLAAEGIIPWRIAKKISVDYDSG